MSDFFMGIFAFLGAFFIFGTLWFWVVSAAFFGLMIYWTEDDSNLFAGICLTAFVWTMASVNDFSILLSPWLWAKWAAIYFVIGTVWSFVKWLSYCHSVRRTLRDHKEKFVKKTQAVLRKDGTFEDHDFAGFADYLNDHYYLGHGRTHKISTRKDVNPSMSENKGNMVRWIVWWPFSAFWTILNDPIRRIAEFIVERFRGAYEGIATSVFKNEV
jgi:hypothetical protein